MSSWVPADAVEDGAAVTMLARRQEQAFADGVNYAREQDRRAERRAREEREREGRERRRREEASDELGQ